MRVVAVVAKGVVVVGEGSRLLIREVREVRGARDELGGGGRVFFWFCFLYIFFLTLGGRWEG